MPNTDRTLPPRLLRRRATALVLAAALAAGVGAGCSDDDDSSSTSSTTTAAVSDGDGTAEETPSPTTEPVELPELTEAEQRYADAVIERAGTERPMLPGADNRCLAVVWVDVIGGERLEASGLSPEEFAAQGPPGLGLDRATAEEMVDAMGQCGAGAEQFYDEWSAVVGLQTGSDRAALACVQEAVSVDDFREALISTFVGGESGVMDGLQERLEECASDDG